MIKYLGIYQTKSVLFNNNRGTLKVEILLCNEGKTAYRKMMVFHFIFLIESLLKVPKICFSGRKFAAGMKLTPKRQEGMSLRV